MEKVIRVCEMTGKVTVVAEGLTTEKAMEMVRELSKGAFLEYYTRVVAR